MGIRLRLTLGTMCVLLALGTSAAWAQVFGTFTWQTLPYCNRVTLTLSNSPAGYTVDGSDDLCGATKKAGATGVAVFNPDGTVGLNFTLVASPTGQAIHISANVSPANGQGTWADDVGNSGAFAFFGAAPGLPVRPAGMVPLDVANNPNQATNPCDVPTVRPTLLLCGTSAVRWVNGGFGIAGLQVWRDAAGQVHIRGSVSRSAGPIASDIMFVLPAPFIPKRTLALTVTTGFSAGAHHGGTALLLVYGPDVPGSDGIVGIFSPSVPAHTVVHFGEVVFSVDR